MIKMLFLSADYFCGKGASQVSVRTIDILSPAVTQTGITVTFHIDWLGHHFQAYHN